MPATVTGTVTCDGCGSEILPGPDREDGERIGLSALAYRRAATQPLWFCSWPCVAAYASTKADL